MALSASVILKPNRLIENFIQLLESFGCTNNIDSIVQQWQTIILQEWAHTEDTVKFWAEVQQSRDAAGNCPYKELFQVTTIVMSIPHSNADIERVFSLMNVIKTELRNTLNIKTINAILMIRTGLTAVHSNCYSYDLPVDVLEGLAHPKNTAKENTLMKRALVQ